MGLIDFLTRVDTRVVPRLARGLRRITAFARGAHVRPLTVVAALLLVAVAGTAVWRLVRPTAATSEGTSPVWVGVRDGDSVPRYIESTRAELAALTAQAPGVPVYALVSFGRYLSPDQTRALAAGAPGLTTLRAYARVPLPGRQTERVVLAAGQLPGDLVADMATVAERKAVDADTYRRMAANEGGEQLRAIYRSNAEVSQAESEALRTGCACVFGLLVRADPGGLAALAAQDQVRSVDPAPEVADADGAVFAAPLPEQVDRVEPPADDLLPN